jgi:hypothetical protein
VTELPNKPPNGRRLTFGGFRRRSVRSRVLTCDHSASFGSVRSCSVVRFGGRSLERALHRTEDYGPRRTRPPHPSARGPQSAAVRPPKITNWRGLMLDVLMPLTSGPCCAAPNPCPVRGHRARAHRQDQTQTPSTRRPIRQRAHRSDTRCPAPSQATDPTHRTGPHMRLPRRWRTRRRHRGEPVTTTTPASR